MNLDDMYVRNLVKEHFFENNHKLTLIMRPDPDFGQKLLEKETEVLEEKVKHLTEDGNMFLKLICCNSRVSFK